MHRLCNAIFGAIRYTMPIKLERRKQPQQASAYLGESTVVPDVALVGEGVGHEAQLALLHVLLDGRQVVSSADLRVFQAVSSDCSVIKSKEIFDVY